MPANQDSCQQPSKKGFELGKLFQARFSLYRLAQLASLPRHFYDCWHFLESKKRTPREHLKFQFSRQLRPLFPCSVANCHIEPAHHIGFVFILTHYLKL